MLNVTKTMSKRQSWFSQEQEGQGQGKGGIHFSAVAAITVTKAPQDPQA
jgi:hypothetical protein